MRDAGFVGLAVTLTLVAGFALAGFEEMAARRGWRYREMRRPGGVAVLLGAALTAAVTGLVPGNVFVGVAAAVAALSGLTVLRRQGRLLSFGVLWVSALAVVAGLDAKLVAFGQPLADMVFTAFLLAAFCSLLREWDAVGWYGWAAAVATAAGTTGVCYWLDRTGDARLGLLVTGATFGVISVSPFGAGMLGRTGARFVALVIGGLAVRAVEGTPSAAFGVVAAAGVIVVLWIVALPRPERARVALSFAGAAGLFGVMSVPAAFALAQTAQPIARTVAEARGLVRVDPTGGIPTAAARLAPLAARFDRYADRLESPAVRVGRYVPFVGAHVRAASVGARSAANLAGSARVMLGAASVRAVSPRNGVIDRQGLRNLNGAMRTIQNVIGESQAAVRAGGNLDLLVPQLRDGMQDLSSQLVSVRQRVDVTIHGARVAENLLGFERPKRFFIAMQNNAESRATGGYIANYGIVTMRDGRVQSREFKRTSDFDESEKPRTLNASLDFRRRYSQFDIERNWTNVNLSPDYPTVAALIADQYTQFSDETIDGVFTLDPIGLAGLMRLTGPVRVASWPTPLTAENVATIVLHDEYRAFDNNLRARVDFLGEVGQAVFDRLIGGGLDDVLRAAPVIEELIEGRRLQLWSPNRDAARFFAATESDGGVRETKGDSLVVTTQNAAANKLDWYLRRSITYAAEVVRDGGDVAVSSTATIRLTNGAPVAGQPRYVIGPNDEGLTAGEHRLFLSVYSPFDVSGATVDGEPLTLSLAPELGRFAYSTFLEIPPGRTRAIEIRFSGRLTDAKRYSLEVFQQPMVAPDSLEISVSRPGKKGKFGKSGPLLRDMRVDVPLDN